MFQVQKHWGFALGFYKTQVDGLKRGDPVTVDFGASTVTRATSATPLQDVYLVDYVRQALREEQTFEDAEAVPTGTYLTLYNISEGVYTLDEEHFASKPALGDELEINASGKFVTATTGTAVASVIHVEGTDTEYKVTIRPKY